MERAEAMDVFDRLASAGYLAPEGDRFVKVFEEWFAACASYTTETVNDAITHLTRTRTSHFWPTLGEMREALAAVTAGREKPGCATCGGSGWVDAGPYKANGGRVYDGVTRCAACGVPPPNLAHLRGQQTPLVGAELRAWHEARQATGPVLRSMDDFRAALQALAARRPMPTARKGAA